MRRSDKLLSAILLAGVCLSGSLMADDPPQGHNASSISGVPVKVTSPTDGQTLVYNALNKRFQNGAGGGGGGSPFAAGITWQTGIAAGTSNVLGATDTNLTVAGGAGWDARVAAGHADPVLGNAANNAGTFYGVGGATYPGGFAGSAYVAGGGVDGAGDGTLPFAAGANSGGYAYVQGGSGANGGNAVVQGGIAFTPGGTPGAVTLSSGYDSDFNQAAVVVLDQTGIAVTGTLSVGAVKFAGTNSTGGGTALLGAANSPASSPSAVYTWIQAKAADGSTVWIPAWK